MIALSGVSQATEDTPDEVTLTFYDLKVGANVIRAGKTFLGSGEDSHELQLALGMKKLDVVFDYGSEKNSRAANYIYENKGNYYRFGIDRNFVKDRKSGNALSLGLRYARATFEDELTYSLDNGFGIEDIALSNSNLQSRWFELTFNLRGKIISNLYTGFTLRWKFARRLQGEGELKTFDIPGFGNTKRQNATAFDYYVMWRIPFK